MSLRSCDTPHMAYEHCPFCEITPEDPRVVRVGEYTLTLLSDPRMTPGHTLVVPRAHIEAQDTNIDEFIAAMAVEAERVKVRMLGARIMGGVFKGVDQWQKSRPYVPQGRIKVDHVHTHVLPSQEGEALYDEQLRWTPDQFSPLPADERDVFRKLLR